MEIGIGKAMRLARRSPPKQESCAALYIFHAVGPVHRGGGEGEAEQLASCYRECLHMAERGLE